MPGSGARARAGEDIHPSLGYLAAAVCAAWLAIAGQAWAATEAYRFDGPVESLEIRGALTVEFVGQAGDEVAVEVESAGERASGVTVAYQAGALSVRNLGGLSKAGDLVVRIRGAGLRSLQTEGASNVRVDALQAERFSLLVQGASDVVCGGQARDARFEIRGAGNIDASRLVAQRAQVELNGAGTVDLHATESLEVTIRGVGRVVYSGGARLRKDISGLGTVSAKP